MTLYSRLNVIVALTLSVGSIAFGQRYTQTNLDSNASGNAEATDPQLLNSWGLTRASGSTWWVMDNLAGVATLYNGPGNKQSLVVTIPPADPLNKKTPIGSPTATMSNGSDTDFLLAPGAAAKFLFATFDGTVAGWNPQVALAAGQMPPSTHAVAVIKANDGSSFTGMTSAFVDGARYLYLANFTKGRVDVYDNAFHPVNLGKGNDGSPRNKPFVDDRLPRNYVPFNVQNIGNNVVVTYVLHEEGQTFETDGPGLGYVDIYNAEGRLLHRLEHGDWLNAPWGVALAPLDFGRFSHELLIGQFAGGGTTESSGRIAAYNLESGKFEGVLQDPNGKPLEINGIWSLAPANVSPANADPDAQPAAQVYFTAGPHQASGGLFGYLTAVSGELTEGTAQ